MKKIMFNDKYGLTQAVLEDRKTMTRRLAVKVLVEDEDGYFRWNGEFEKPRYEVGDVVAVAQAYQDVRNGSGYPVDSRYDAFRTADWSEGTNGSLKATAGEKNKMYVKAELMPHQIRITSVHIERLRDISDEDCLREGIYRKTCCPPGDIDYFYHSEPRSKNEVYPTPRAAFAGLIDKVSGKGTWVRNPWVFVYEFELVK